MSLAPTICCALKALSSGSIDRPHLSQMTVTVFISAQPIQLGGGLGLPTSVLRRYIADDPSISKNCRVGRQCKCEAL